MYEYTYVFEDCGEDIARRVMEVREVNHIQHRLKKVSFFVTADHLATILAGIDRKDQVLIEEGIEALVWK
jgi:aminoglycoside 2''-phosphotransferase